MSKTYRVVFKKNGQLFIPPGAGEVILDQWTDLDASTESRTIVEYTVANDKTRYFESLLDNSDGVSSWS